MKIDRNGKLYALIRYGGFNPRWKKLTVCNAFWYVVWGLLRAPLIGLAAAFGVCCVLGIFVGFPLFELGFWIAYGLRPDTPTLWVLGIIGMAWVFTLYNVFAALSGKRVLENTLECVSDVIGARWRDVKNKTCTVVEIE